MVHWIDSYYKWNKEQIFEIINGFSTITIRCG